MIGRRGFITGLVSLVAAPAIVRAGSLMPVKLMIEPRWYSHDEVVARYMGVDIIEHLDLDAMCREMFQIMAVPQHWMVAK